MVAGAVDGTDAVVVRLEQDLEGALEESSQSRLTPLENEHPGYRRKATYRAFVWDEEVWFGEMMR